MILGVPLDIYINYLYSNNNFILVKDPKHTLNDFHYTIWSKNNIKNFTELSIKDKNELLD